MSKLHLAAVISAGGAMLLVKSAPQLMFTTFFEFLALNIFLRCSFFLLKSVIMFYTGYDNLKNFITTDSRRMPACVWTLWWGRIHPK